MEYVEMVSMKRGWLAAALAAASLLAGPALAKYPDKSVRIVVPFGPGGVADITARIVAEKLSDKLGQRFYVENQPGAGGIVAARSVISSPPDGSTLVTTEYARQPAVAAVGGSWIAPRSLLRSGEFGEITRLAAEAVAIVAAARKAEGVPA